MTAQEMRLTEPWSPIIGSDPTGSSGVVVKIRQRGGRPDRKVIPHKSADTPQPSRPRYPAKIVSSYIDPMRLIKLMV